MPLSANFRREMLTAIKNAKKKREEEQAADEQSPEGADSDDVVRSGSKMLAKPVNSNRSLQINDETSSGQNQTIHPKTDQTRLKK